VVDVQDEKSYDHLTHNERHVLEREIRMISVSVSYSMLFRYATKADLAIYILGAVCAIAGGAATPFMTVCTIAIERDDLVAKSI
jgi:ATP-binding cassette subfamily B (MDR/TAP) protein 1